MTDTPAEAAPPLVDILQLLVEHIDDAFAADSGAILMRLDAVRAVFMRQVEIKRPGTERLMNAPAQARWAIIIHGAEPAGTILIAKGRNAALEGCRLLARSCPPRSGVSLG